MTIPTNDKRRCYNCRWALRQDTGYSNYTVLETEIHCLKNLSPYFPVNEGYGAESEDHKFMRVAELCNAYERGEPLYFDCDLEKVTYPHRDVTERFHATFYSKDHEVIAAYAEYVDAGGTKTPVAAST